MAKKIGITETVLRDAHQSLIATRMPIGDMLPILEKMDKVGFHSLECWGGATFDACLRFLNEDRSPQPACPSPHRRSFPAACRRWQPSGSLPGCGPRRHTAFPRRR